MGKRPQYEVHLSSIPAADRFEQAISTIKGLTDRAQEVIDVHENNVVFSYSDQISKQVSDTYAGQAFAVTRNSLTAYEALKTAALWDKAQKGTVSIPTAIALLDSPSVIRLVAKEIWERHASQACRFVNPDPGPEVQASSERMMEGHQLEFAGNQKRLCIADINRVMRIAKHAMWECDELDSLLNTRHYIAHHLESTRSERDGRKHVQPKWQGVWNIQQMSIWMIETLYCWVNGTSFSLDDDCRRIASDNASDFWGNAHFNPER